jgi:hypothetical protein
LEEKRDIAEELSSFSLRFKVFSLNYKFKTFPFEAKPFFNIKYRRWEDPDSGKTYSRDWQLVSSGTRITAEFGTFFKELHRSQ